MSTDPQAADPNQVGYSLANVGELLTACLDASEGRSVLEVGAFKGELTALLLEWAKGSGASVAAIEPLPPEDLLAVSDAHPELELIEDTSTGPLSTREMPDAIVIDGDHNYFTLSGELRTIAARSAPAGLPLLMFHDVNWPHARRDSYYAPERVPADERQPLAENTGLAPGEPGTVADGLPFEYVAQREGGPRNGVLTAIEDFMAQHDGLRLVQVPAFFGFGVLWREDAPYDSALSELLRPFDGNPVLGRLEANRVAHLVTGHARTKRLLEAEATVHRQEELLRSMIASRAFAIAEKLSTLRRRGGEPAFSRKRVEEVLRDGDSA